MDMSVVYLLGLSLAALLWFQANRISIGLTVVFWLMLLFWSLLGIPQITLSPLTWSSALNIEVSYQIDGLSNLFVVLISGIGALIFSYTLPYFSGDAISLKRCSALLQLFALSMLGIVIFDNMLLLYCAWEMTSLISYVLIQFNKENSDANQNAFNGFFITMLGGISLLVAIILLYSQAGTWQLSEILAKPENSQAVLSSYWFLGLLFLAAFTKSAQFPFSFWLNGAMRAPTPVSAYLHSATMVNAGIYLLARFHPVTSEFAIWYPVLAFFGLTTMLIASFRSLFEDDLKGFLAQTTLFALGTMVNLLASNKWLAAEALVIFLFFHGIYKAAAFMTVGAIDKEYGTRSLSKLRGIAKERTGLKLLLIIIFSAMAGLPPFFGFITKEMALEAKLAGETISYFLVAISLLSSIFIAASSFKFLIRLIYPEEAKETTPRKVIKFIYLNQALLAAIIILMSIYHNFFVQLIQFAANAIVNDAAANFVSPNALLTGALGMSIVIAGVLLFIAMQKFQIEHIYPSDIYRTKQLFERGLHKILKLGGQFTLLTQHAGLTKQLKMVLFSLCLCLFASSTIMFQFPPTVLFEQFLLTSFFVIVLLSLYFQSSFIENLVDMSLIGVALILFFITQGAPDVTMTLILVEILTVILVIIALRNTSIHRQKSPKTHWLFSAVIALFFSSMIYSFLVTIANTPTAHTAGQYFLANSVQKGHGANVVNVILVDFRSLDTLAEALVIFAACLAVWLFNKRGQSVRRNQTL